MDKIEVFLKNSLIDVFFNYLNIEIDEKKIDYAVDKFLLYLEELKKWNKTYNLTSIKDEGEIIIKHFIDSLFYIYFIPEKPLKIADVGSGAGFPGIAIAIIREYMKISLIETSWKKCAFLKNIKKKLDLDNIEIIQSKAEEVNQKFDIVTIRALWRIKDIIKNCYHLLKEGGYFIVSKSIKLESELKQLDDQMKIELKEFILPRLPDSSEGGKRFIIKLC